MRLLHLLHVGLTPTILMPRLKEVDSGGILSFSKCFKRFLEGRGSDWFEETVVVAYEFAGCFVDYFFVFAANVCQRCGWVVVAAAAVGRALLLWFGGRIAAGVLSIILAVIVVMISFRDGVSHVDCI